MEPLYHAIWARKNIKTKWSSICMTPISAMWRTFLPTWKNTAATVVGGILINYSIGIVTKGVVPMLQSTNFRDSTKCRRPFSIVWKSSTSSLPLVYRLWLWSDPRSHHRRATYPSFEMVAKTRTHLSQCGFQCPRIWRSQVLRECRSQSTDREHDDIHGFHRRLGLWQCRITMGVCNRRLGRSDRKVRDKVGKITQEKIKKKRIK